MKTSLTQQIKRLVTAQSGEEFAGTFEVDFETIRQHDEYPDRFTAEGFLNGTRIPLAWKRISITPDLNENVAGTLLRDEAEVEGLYYDSKIMHHFIAVRPNHNLTDVNRILGTEFTDEQLLFKTERFEGQWHLNHPCFYGRIFTQVLLPKAS